MKVWSKGTHRNLLISRRLRLTAPALVLPSGAVIGFSQTTSCCDATSSYALLKYTSSLWRFEGKILTGTCSSPEDSGSPLLRRYCLLVLWFRLANLSLCSGCDATGTDSALLSQIFCSMLAAVPQEFSALPHSADIDCEFSGPVLPPPPSPFLLVWDFLSSLLVFSFSLFNPEELPASSLSDILKNHPHCKPWVHYLNNKYSLDQISATFSSMDENKTCFN